MDPDGGAGGFERGHAPGADGGDDPGEGVAGPGAGEPRRRWRGETEAAVGRCDQRVGPLVDHHRARTAGGFEGAIGFRAGKIAEQLHKFAFVRGEDGVMALQPFGLADQGDGVGVNDHRPGHGQREGQDWRDVAEAGADQDCADPRVVDLCRVGLDHRRGQAVDAARGRDADIAGPGPCCGAGGERDRAGHLPSEAMDHAAGEFIARRVERREGGFGDFVPVRSGVDADVGEDDATHGSRCGHHMVSRFECAESDGQIIGADGRQEGAVVSRDSTWQVAGYGHLGCFDQRKKFLGNSVFQRSA